MTRARGKTSPETVDETGPDNEDGARPLFGGEVREDNHVAVFRMDKQSMKWAYCAKMATDITEDTLKERGGGGLYKCVERGPGPSGRGIVYVQQVRVKIAGQELPWKDLPGDLTVPELPVGTVAAPVTQGGITMNDILVQSVLDMQRQTREASEASARASREHSEAMMSLLKRDTSDPKMDRIMEILLTKAMAPPPPPPDNTAILLKMFEVIADRQVPPPPPSMLDQMETMDRLLDLKMKAKELLAGGGDDEDSSDPITMLARALLPSLMQAGGAPPVAIPGTPRLAPVPAPTAPPAQGTDVASPLWMMQLNRLKPPLLAWAKEGKDPFKVADHVLEFMVPPAMKGGLREFLSDPEAVNKLLVAMPELQPFTKWTGEVMDGMHQILFPELYDDDGQGEAVVPVKPEELGGVVEGQDGDATTD